MPPSTTAPSFYSGATPLSADPNNNPGAVPSSANVGGSVPQTGESWESSGDSSAPATEPAVISSQQGSGALNTAIAGHQATVSNIQAANAPTTAPGGNNGGNGSNTPAAPSAAAVSAIQAQGGITADEAASTGVNSDMLVANYNYDTNTGYYVPKDNTAGVTAASNQYVADQAKIVSSFTSATGGFDAATQNLINSITAMYQSRITAQQAVNANEQSAVNSEDIRNGTSRYAGGVAGGILTTEENTGLDRITAIQNDMAQAIATAQDNLQTENYKAFMDEQDKLSSLQTEQTGILKDLHDQAVAEKNRLQDQQTAITTSINNVAMEAAKNGAPSSLLASIGSAKTEADAIAAAGDYLQTSSDPQVQGYIMYKQGANSSGQVPESYATWKAADDAQTAKEKDNEAYGTAFATKAGELAATNQYSNTGTGATSPVVASTGAMKGITVNAPADIAPYVQFSANGVKYVDLSTAEGTPTEKAQMVADAQAAGFKVITNKATGTDVQNITDASAKLADMKAAFDANNSGNAAKRDSYSAAIEWAAKALQTNPAAVGTNEYQDTALDILKALSGTQGFRGGASIIDQVKSTFPQNTDTQAVVDSKIATLQKLLGDRETALVGTPSASDQLLISGNQAQGSLTDFVTNTPTMTINGASTSSSAIISSMLRQPGATPTSVYNALKARGLITDSGSSSGGAQSSSGPGLFGGSAPSLFQ